MAEVGVRALKARLSEHLRRARDGERLTVTDRGRAIATLGPVDHVEQPGPPAWLRQLATEGRVALGAGGRPLGSHPRVKLRAGATLSEAVIEDRR